MTKLLATIVAAMFMAAPAFAQSADARWTPWLGCWRVQASAPGAARATVCVAPDGPGVNITTTLESAPPMVDRLITDGSSHPLAEGACRGTQRAEWSRDGYRLFSTAELTCADGARRNVSGISLIAPDGTWIEAQAIAIGDRSNVRVRRFTRNGPPPTGSVRERLTVDQVQEASQHVAAPALQAALVESRATFGLTSRRLVALADAGLPDSLIDLMVALTYPQAFEIRPASRADRLTPFLYDDDDVGAGLPWFPGGVLPVDPYFNSAYYWSPFGYAAFGAYPILYGVAGAGDVEARGGGRSRPAANTGRVINGLGYTRQAPRQAEDTASRGGGRATGGGRVSTEGYTRGDSGGSSGGGGGSSSGGSSGSSSGGSSGGGRTAVDR